MTDDYSKKSDSVGVMEVDNGQPLTTIISPKGKVVQITDDVDQAMDLALEADHQVFSEKEDRKLLFKLDCIVLPLFSFLYMIQFMDKTSIGFAAVMGIQADYNMKGQMYSWTNSCFYLGYLCAAPFSAILLQKLPIIKAVSTFIVIWGIIQCLHVTAKSYATFVLLRTLLGVLESFVSPIFVVILNQYYRHAEHFGRTAIFYGFNGLGTVVLSGISYGLFERAGQYTMKPYKVLFMIIGIATIVNGLLIMLIMPDTPAQARFLTHREKLNVVERIRGNNQGFGNKHFKKYQLIECVTDVRTWIYFAIGILVAIPNGGISGFGTILLKSMGYSSIRSLLIKAPLGGVECVGLIALRYLSIFIKKRMILGISYMVLVVIASCLLAFAAQEKAQLAGYYLLGVAPVGIILVTSCVTSNTAGHTKKLVANAISLVGYSCGNIIGPQTFQSSDAPHYPKAKATVVGCYCGAIVLMIILTVLNVTENRRRDKQREKMGDKYKPVENMEFADLTDGQNPEFRYRI
ncbi:hypothetical protein KL925_005094 [Ogataea polymorpha]|nr:hypothetical protein KL936_005044 [Ogataea polymorpha]KAG7924663.1 hypothetical protein KL925_005094 [Ogataea polymorpha]